MTPQDLKNSLLQRAIQGKLVPQDPKEGSGEELLSQIREEKKRLLNEGKIKKEKPLPEIADDEKPFEIPDNWVWVRLGDILNLLVDGLHTTPRYTKIGIPFVSVKDMSSGKLDLTKTKFISEEDYRQLFKRFTPRRGDILLSKVGTTGIPTLVDTDIEFGLFVSVALLKFNANLIVPNFLIYSIQAPYFQQQCREHTRGVGNKNWVLNDIANTVLPFPPLSEQNRIVSKLESLQPFIESFARAWTRLEELSSRFPSELRKSLLQRAIEGRLVPRDPSEGTGADLLREIQKEKKRLIEEGKIKKEKPLPEILDDEKPFEIPGHWTWVRWGELSESIQYGYNAPASSNGNVRLLRISDIQNNQVVWENVPFCMIKEEEVEAYLLEKNDLLFARTGGTVGKSYLVQEVPYKTVYAGYLIRTRYSKLLCPQYLKNFMESGLYWTQLRNGTIATAQPNCNGKTLAKMLVPLPPLSEQKRIVEQLEELLPLCDRLTNARERFS